MTKEQADQMLAILRDMHAALCVIAHNTAIAAPASNGRYVLIAFAGLPEETRYAVERTSFLIG